MRRDLDAEERDQLVREEKPDGLPLEPRPGNRLDRVGGHQWFAADGNRDQMFREPGQVRQTKREGPGADSLLALALVHRPAQDVVRGE